MSDRDVYIVLATYQGEAYLPQLLASIRAQSHQDCTTLVRDDGSTDGTRSILHKAAVDDRRIVLLDDAAPRLGAIGNFSRLLEEARRRGAEFVLLADQDDVWHADKVARQVQTFDLAEVFSGRDVPQLVFCDAAVIDAAGQTLNASFLRHNRLPFRSPRPLATLLGRCYVLGCTCAINRALLELALPLPELIASHDWWLALCAAMAGQIACIDAPLLDYRRHGANASQSAIWREMASPIQWRRRWNIGWTNFQRSLEQARALRERLRERNLATGEAAELLGKFCDILEDGNRWRRLRQLHRLGVPAIGGLRRILYDVCMFMK